MNIKCKEHQTLTKIQLYFIKRQTKETSSENKSFQINRFVQNSKFLRLKTKNS